LTVFAPGTCPGKAGQAQTVGLSCFPAESLDTSASPAFSQITTTWRGIYTHINTNSVSAWPAHFSELHQVRSVPWSKLYGNHCGGTSTGRTSYNQFH